jgi:putative transposase
LRWHRDLVARKWTFLERRRPGRPRTKIDIEQLIVRMAQENPSSGYTRIRGALLISTSRWGALRFDAF